MSRSVPSRSHPSALGDVFWLASAGAVVAALIHVAVVEFRFRVLHVFTWTNREFAWLSLAGYLACFLVVAVPVGLLARTMRRWMGVRVVATIFATLVGFAVLLLWQKLHPLAQLALALGVGVRAGAMVGAAPESGMRLVRLLATSGALLLGGLGLLAYARPRLEERRSLARLPEASTHAPNIILLIMDTVRASSLSLYGYGRLTTPVLDRLASESTVFDHAFSVAPWTAPSHASMMTGLWASQTGADYLNPLHDSLTTVAEVLARRGYATGGFMANSGYAGYQLGISRGFARYEDFPLSWRQALWSTTLAQTGSGQLMLEGLWQGAFWRVRRAITRPDLRTITVRKAQPQTAAEIARNFFTWRDGIEGRPYFAMLNFMDAHAPYDPPDGYRTRFNGGKTEVDRYDGAIAYEDSIIGDIVVRLQARGDMDRTVFIVTSDHGEQFGEHGLKTHGNSLYLPLLHVPLLVFAPERVNAG